MTPAAAAKVIGCSSQHVRMMCRFGRIKADKIQTLSGQFEYSISIGEARRVKEAYLSSPKTRGRPRGTKIVRGVNPLPMNGFYVYGWYKNSSTYPFYVGRGAGKRATAPHYSGLMSSDGEMPLARDVRLFESLVRILKLNFFKRDYPS